MTREEYIGILETENAELKKQLEEKTKIGVADHKYASKCEDKVVVMEAKQREFIKWLEKKQSFLRDEISELTLGMCNTDFQDIKLEVYQEVLQKYKEIVNGSEQK